MQVILADNAGMCFGVKRALDIARQVVREASAGRKARVIGQLVHNRKVSEYINALGIDEIPETELENQDICDEIFIIPSHGKGPHIYDIVRAKSGQIADATCPHVRQALEKALEAHREGRFLLIYGDLLHDEVVGYRQWLGEDCLVISEFEETLSVFPLPRKLAVMSQTTADQAEFYRLISWLQSRGCEPLVIDSICEATRIRRESAERLAAQVDAMLVVGGKNSANTRHLTEYCRNVVQNVHWIETAQEIDFRWFTDVNMLGITAGASTPEWIIKEVIEMMDEFRDQDRETMQSQELDEMIQDEATLENSSAGAEEAASDPVADGAEQADKAAGSVDIQKGEEEMIQQSAAPQAAQEDTPEQETDQQGDTESDMDQDAEADFSKMEAELGFLDFHPGDLVKGTVVKVSSDEVLVDIGHKSEGIIPVFELAFTKVDPFSIVRVGEEITVEVVKEDRDGNIVLSRKNALFEERINLLEEQFENGEPVEAEVIDVVKGGLLVDVGMRGFVPASHVERGFVKDLSEYLHRTFNFKILELNRATRKVILSRKALLEEEYQKTRDAFWASIEEGQTRKGIVKRLTDFGAFVDIGGCDGLLHVSEMGWGKIGKPSDVVAINDEIEVYVLRVDREKEKVSLSLKKLIPNPWDLASEKYQVGSIYTGKVMRGASFGAFIQLEPSLEGLAHISQLARFRVNKVEDVLVEGMEIPVKILDIDLEKKRISLSVKEAIDLPKLAGDEPAQEPKERYAADEEESFEKATESFMESSSDDAGAGTVAEALGAAFADRLAGVVAGATADKESSEADADAAADDYDDDDYDDEDDL